MQFSDKNDLLKYISEWGLRYLDSEYSYRTKDLVRKFNAKGIDMSRWWVMTPENWQCPCCKRNKEQIVRLNKHGYLIARLDEHHDHMQDFVSKEFIKCSEASESVVADVMAERFVTRTAFALSAYDPTIVCFDCNSADSDAKKLLNLPSEFSFSPAEIESFILVNDNEKHLIDFNKASDVWVQCEPMFLQRKKLVAYIANLAATNNHWYQPSLETSRQIERKAKNRFHSYGLTSMGIEPPEQILYSPNKFSGAKNSWRIKRNAIADNPPNSGELNTMVALRGKYWVRASEDWSCQVCGRSKYECVRKNNKGEWYFQYTKSKEMYLNRNTTSRHDICNDCSDTIKHIGVEIKEIEQLPHLFCNLIMSTNELTSVIKSAPHSKHNIHNEVLEELLPTLIERSQHV